MFCYLKLEMPIPGNDCDQGFCKTFFSEIDKLATKIDFPHSFLFYPNFMQTRFFFLVLVCMLHAYRYTNYSDNCLRSMLIYLTASLRFPLLSMSFCLDSCSSCSLPSAGWHCPSPLQVKFSAMSNKNIDLTADLSLNFKPPPC